MNCFHDVSISNMLNPYKLNKTNKIKCIEQNKKQNENKKSKNTYVSNYIKEIIYI